jgi:hypothetical protein
MHVVYTMYDSNRQRMRVSHGVVCVDLYTKGLHEDKYRLA